MQSQQNGSVNHIVATFGHDLRHITPNNPPVYSLATSFYIHPGWRATRKYNFLDTFRISSMWDIALIELNVTKSLPDSVRSICLPKHNVTNWDNEYAVRAGWGLVNRTTTPLQMSHIKVFGRNEMGRRLDIIEEYYRRKYHPMHRQSALERYLFGTPADRDVLACKVYILHLFNLCLYLIRVTLVDHFGNIIREGLFLLVLSLHLH